MHPSEANPQNRAGDRYVGAQQGKIEQGQHSVGAASHRPHRLLPQLPRQADQRKRVDRRGQVEQQRKQADRAGTAESPSRSGQSGRLSQSEQLSRARQSARARQDTRAGQDARAELDTRAGQSTRTERAAHGPQEARNRGWFEPAQDPARTASARQSEQRSQRAASSGESPSMGQNLVPDALMLSTPRGHVILQPRGRLRAEAACHAPLQRDRGELSDPHPSRPWRRRIR